MDGGSVEKEKTGQTAANSVKTNNAANGYATMPLQTLETRSDKIDSSLCPPYQGSLKLSQRDLGILLLSGILCGLIFATIPQNILLGSCSLLKVISRISLPGLTTASLFYWCGVTVQKYLDSKASLWIMPVFLLTEILVQILKYFYTDSNRITTYVSLVVVIIVSVLYVLPESRGEGTYIFAVCLMFTNVFDKSVAGESHGLLRCIFINFAAFAGDFLTRLVILPSADKPSEIEAKSSCAASKTSFKTRRSSSASSTNSRRRTSLPVLNHGLNLTPKSTVDATTLGEAHGMLSDLLADSNLPANVASTLKIISTMIAQPTFSSFARGVNSMSPLVENRFVPDEKICEQPDMRDDGWRSRPHHNRRMSNLFTTTTSATGMPTPISVEREGGVAIPNNIGHNIPGSPRSGSPTFLPSSKLLRQVKSLPHNMPHLQDTAKPNEARSSSPILRKIPSENGAFTAVNEEKPQLDENCKACGCSEPHVTNLESSEACGTENELTFSAMSFYGKRKPTVDEILEKAKDLQQSEEVEKLYDKIDNWNFPIFDVWENGNILRGVAFKIFKKSGFFEKFRIREQVFLNYFTALEAGYNDIPYHNSAHAADVLHGVYYFTTQRIAGFCPFDSGDCNSDSDSVSGDQSDEATECVEHYDRLTSCIPDLERFALYSAAAMHDYDHPGRTNAFVVATLEPQALLYNDRSVLENHHAAQAFSLLLSNPEYNYVESLTTADFKRFRFLVIEAVLATDLKRHFDVLQEFTAKVDSGACIDWSLEADRLLASQVCIKMADISGPTKQKDIHQRWTERIVEEFYEQGEDELSKGLPVSPYMDRKVPLVAQLQETFIKHLVAPLFRAYRSAGLLPGVWVTSSEYDVTNDSDGDSSSKDDESTEHSDSGVGRHRSYPGKKRLGKKRKRRKRRRASKEIHCEIMENIESNYQMWSRRIKEMELEKQACSKAKGKDNSPEGGGTTSDGDAPQGGAADKKETDV